MHKKRQNICAACGCNAIISTKYMFCSIHKDTIYNANCNIHGVTKFKHGKCIKCAALKVPLYNITVNNNKYYDKDGKLFKKNSSIAPYLKLLCSSKHDMISHINNTTKLHHNPGVYGIFVKSKRNKHNIGKCLYIGQSIDVCNRIESHKYCFKKAQRHIIGTKQHHKHITISKLQHKVDYKYYKMANSYKLSELMFVALLELPHTLLNKADYKETLTYCEQAYMNKFKPLYNTFAARPSI